MNSYWSMCIHESAHAIVGIVLGGKCIALRASADSGAARVSDLCPTHHAFMVAAGDIAESLLGDAEPPAQEPLVRVAPPPVTLVEAKRQATLAASRPDQHGPTDDVQLAQWAIAGIEGEPHRWADRVTWAKAYAERLVVEHRDTILRLAAKLYQHGILFEHEILEATK